MQIFHVVVNGDLASPKLSLEIKLCRACDFCRASERHSALGEQSDREVKQCLRFGQVHPPQGFVRDFDYHIVTVPVASAYRKDQNDGLI